MKRFFPWILRIAWVLLPFVAGPAIDAAVRQHSTPVQILAAVGLWTAFAVGLVATLVPHPLGLTTLRLLAPGTLAAAVAASIDHHPSALAVLCTGIVTALVLLPPTSLYLVNGPAYPNERRYPLRIPASLLLGPLELAWAVVVIGPSVGLLLLASKAWVAGVIVSVLTIGVAVLLMRPLHGLSRRWVVMVPAGLVLHDPMSLADPVLFRRQIIEALRPAPEDSDSLDLTQRAFGLRLELLLREKVPMVLIKPGERLGESGASARLLFTPTRPGAVLTDAGGRRIPVG